MPRYKVKTKCYFGEKGKKPQLLYPGEYYDSPTLEEKDAPKYFQLIGGKKPAAPAPAAPVVKTPEPSADVGMTYHEMKTFVADNGIQVPDYQKPTLINAIKDFKAGGGSEEETPEPSAEEVEEVAPELPQD